VARIAQKFRSPALWLVLAGLCGCEQVAKLDDLYVDERVDAGSARDAGPDPHAELRALCLTTLNAHRASLNLAPLSRASRQQEDCADDGAEADQELNMPHYAAQNRSSRCDQVGFGPQNSCPNWRFGPGSEHESAADALVDCIDRMWSQGEPTQPVAECQKDLSPDGCYAQHGEWINMTNTRVKYVACGIALGDGTIWVNQDFSAH
jgi:hypothetical protein